MVHAREELNKFIDKAREWNFWILSLSMFWGLKLGNSWSFQKLHVKTNLKNVFESWDTKTAKLIVDTCARETDTLLSDATLLHTHTHIYMMASKNFIMYDAPFYFLSLRIGIILQYFIKVWVKF